MVESYEGLIARIRYHIQKANFMGLKEHEGTLLLKEAADAIEELLKALDGRDRNITHWMPLPTPLKEEDK